MTGAHEGCHSSEPDERIGGGCAIVNISSQRQYFRRVQNSLNLTLDSWCSDIGFEPIIGLRDTRS